MPSESATATAAASRGVRLRDLLCVILSGCPELAVFNLFLNTEYPVGEPLSGAARGGVRRKLRQRPCRFDRLREAPFLRAFLGKEERPCARGIGLVGQSERAFIQLDGRAVVGIQT